MSIVKGFKGFRTRVAAGFAITRKGASKPASDMILTGEQGWRNLGGRGFGQIGGGSEKLLIGTPQSGKLLLDER